jgi:hypothetical protein
VAFPLPIIIFMSRIRRFDSCFDGWISFCPIISMGRKIRVVRIDEYIAYLSYLPSLSIIPNILFCDVTEKKKKILAI